VERDGNLITGQNPNSSASIARALVTALNHQLPEIFDHTPEAIVPAQVIAEFPVNTFLENIAIDRQGTIFVILQFNVSWRRTSTTSGWL
jgi:hypothetical protein